MTTPPLRPTVAQPTALRVTVTNANLQFVRHPMMVGHYRAMALTGSEYTLDSLIGGTMSTALRVGLYPDKPGTQQIFINTAANHDNPLQPPRPDAVIVVGLGEEGTLRATDLAATARQGVMAWAHRLMDADAKRTRPFELASALISSSGSGSNPGQSAQMIAIGVRDANVRLREAGWPLVDHLHFVELYLDRATDAWRGVQILAGASPGDFILSPFLQTGLGGLQRPLESSYRGSAFDLITAVTERDERGESMIGYTVDTRRARTELRAQATQLKLLRELTAVAAEGNVPDAQIGRSLFRLLVPLEMQPFLGGSDALVLELDRGTASIPWELLDTTASAGDRPGGEPWALRTKLLRRLRTEEFREQVQDANSDGHVLIIGEPRCDDPAFPRLPAARAEAQQIAQLFATRGTLGAGKLKPLICGPAATDVGPDARTVVNALLERDWRIIHIAGHGVPAVSKAEAARAASSDVMAGDPRGVVLSNGTYLGRREIGKMPVVPQLVFVNCCWTGVGDSDQLLHYHSRSRGERAQFAAGVAEELIAIGVRCVVVAGWAVEDVPAMTFSTNFYQGLLDGKRFIDCVHEARDAAWRKGGNTWAAYQCYGDPDWRFVPPAAGARLQPQSADQTYAGVASWRALLFALEAIAVESRYQGTDKARSRAHLQLLETRFRGEWGTIGAVAEAFGVAWAQLGDRRKAIDWYTSAVATNDSSASIKAMQELGNLRARVALEGVEAMRRAATASGDDSALPAAIDTARDEIHKVIAMLEQLVKLQPTIERESLCGSAWKRLAMLEAIAADASAELSAIEQMRRRYDRAESLARTAQHPELFYPALNRMAAELIVEASHIGWTGFDPAHVADVRASLERKIRDDPDFWSVVGVTELAVYEAVSGRTLASSLEIVLADYERLHQRVSAPWMWASVYDQSRWVLGKYVVRAHDAEDAAAAALLARLSNMATVI